MTQTATRQQTQVVNLKNDRFEVYIGRANPRKRLKGSKFANPFKYPRDGGREEVVRKYRAWLMAQPELVAAAKKELTGKVLGCWCKPDACHGDVLIEVCEGRKE